jgi:hypothetical protein
MAAKRQLERIEGQVETRRVLQGTGSEHHGVVLTTTEGEQLRLQRIGANPFQDTATEALDGQRVALEGFRLDNVFRYVRVCDKP